MGMWLGRGRKARRCYGFDEIALVPGSVTINPNEVDTSWQLSNKKYRVPIIASAMDGVVDVNFAVLMSKLGGLAALNLEGVQTRYDNPHDVLTKIANASLEEATQLLQTVYKQPIKEKLVSKRVKEIKKKGGVACVSSIPQRAESFGKIAQDSGADIFIVQSTVTTVRHISTEYKTLDFFKFCKTMKIPVIIGNCVTYDQGVELMEAGADALLHGFGKLFHQSQPARDPTEAAIKAPRQVLQAGGLEMGLLLGS